jgi:beta-glucosidase
VTDLAAAPAALLVSFGATDAALVDVLLGDAPARGRLAFDLPRSMQTAAASRSDVSFDTADPVFRFGDGLP